MKTTRSFFASLAALAMLLGGAGQSFADELVVTETGNVGIGLNEPSSKLQIIGANNPIPLRIGYNGNGNDLTMDIAAGQGLANIAAGAVIKSDGTGYQFLGTRGASRISLTDGSLLFFTSNSKTGTPGADVEGLTAGQAKMVIGPTGNVGIATNNPLGKLHVPGGNGTPAIYLIGEDNIWFDAGQVRITTHDGYGNWQVKQGADNDDKYCGAGAGAIKLKLEENGIFQLSTAPSGKIGGNINWNLGLTQTSAGKVGIGTAAPAAKLEVNGNIKYKAGSHTVQMTNTPGYLEYIIDGNPYGVSIWASSRKFKEDIKDLDVSSEQICALEPVSFRWVEERGGKKDFGLIAEDVAKTIPALALYDKEGKPFSVRYELLSVLLLKELKSQQKINTQLMNHLSRLEKRIEALETAK